MKRSGAFLARLLVLVGFLLLAGCSVLPKSAPPQATYDLGPPPAKPVKTLPATMQLGQVTAPGWMNDTGMLYRLDYANATRVRAYAQSRWVAPPAALFEQRLQAFYNTQSSQGSDNNVNTRVALRLVRFEQVFTAPKEAHADLRLQVTVYDRDDALVAQRTFSGQEPCVTPDAEGGVKALSKLSDRVIRHLLTWLANEPWAKNSSGRGRA